MAIEYSCYSFPSMVRAAIAVANDDGPVDISDSYPMMRANEVESVWETRISSRRAWASFRRSLAVTSAALSCVATDWIGGEMKRVVALACVVVCLNTPVARAASGDVVAFWKLAERQSHTAEDASGHEHQASLHGVQWAVEKERGYAYCDDFNLVEQ